MQNSDLRQFNKEWMKKHLHGRFPSSIVANLPLLPKQSTRVMDVAEKVGECFARAALPISGLEKILQTSGMLDPRESEYANAPVTIDATRLAREWLFLARLSAKDVLAGKWLPFMRMHMKYSEAAYYADLTNDQINTLALRAGSLRIQLLEWAWAPRIFEVSDTLPSTFDNAWTFALSV
jgi:hypothetical protein